MAKHDATTIVKEPESKPQSVETSAPPVEETFVPHHEDPFLSFAECGLLVGRTRQTIRNWVNDGILRAQKDPGSSCRRVRRSDLVRFYGATALAEKRPLGGEAVDALRSNKVSDNG